MCEQLLVDAELENEQAANDIAEAVEETETTEAVEEAKAAE